MIESTGKQGQRTGERVLGDRVLGAGWASVHGPSQPRAMAVWALERGFRGLLASPTPRPIDWGALREAVRDLPFSIPGHRVASLGQDPDERLDAGLCRSKEGDVEAARASISKAVRDALALGADRILLEPGVVPRGPAFAVAGSESPDGQGAVDLADEGAAWTPEIAQAKKRIRDKRLDPALDAACRNLHGLCRRYPEVTFCLAPSRHVFGLGELHALEAIFSDLGRYKVAYWHDTAVVARRAQLLGEEEGAWLENFGPRMAGVTLGDADPDGRLHLPPGAGTVDFQLLAGALARTGFDGREIVRAVELRPDVHPDEVPGVHLFLDKYGI